MDESEGRSMLMELRYMKERDRTRRVIKDEAIRKSDGCLVEDDGRG